MSTNSCWAQNHLWSACASVLTSTCARTHTQKEKKGESTKNVEREENESNMKMQRPRREREDGAARGSVCVRLWGDVWSIDLYFHFSSRKPPGEKNRLTAKSASRGYRRGRAFRWILALKSEKVAKTKCLRLRVSLLKGCIWERERIAQLTMINLLGK